MGFPQAKFYGILDQAYVDSEDWERKCHGLLIGGAGVVQMRAKDVTQTERRGLIERILPLFTDSTIPLIVNDDLELALEFPDLGLHLGQEDTPVTEARAALGSKRPLGLSTHSPAQVDAALEQAELLSYFAVGPIFATPTKPSYEPVGLDLVRYAAKCQPALPWYAIGGIKRSNFQSVCEAGAHGVVAVSDVLCAEDTSAAVASYLAE